MRIWPGVLESSGDLRGQCAECWGKSVGIRRSTASLDDKGLHAPPARDVAIALVHLLSRITGCYLHAGTMKRAEVSLSLFFSYRACTTGDASHRHMVPHT